MASGYVTREQDSKSGTMPKLANAMFEHIKVRAEDELGRVVLNRPNRRNALSLTLMTEVIDALEELANTGSARVIIIEGAGPVFSAGHDLGEMVDRPPEFFRELFACCTKMMQTIHRLPQPVIAKVHGIATAAGCQLVASCDLAVAAEGARFATPGVKIGFFCTTPMVPLVRAVGQKRAMEMLLTGEPIEAETAQAWGLINRVVPLAHLEDATLQLAGQITRYSPSVIALGKKAFYRQSGLPENQAYAIAEPVMASNASLDDAQEGFRAFLDKRVPRWSHQQADESE